MWSFVEKEVDEHLHKTKNPLKAAMSDMNKEQLIRVCNQFQPHIEAVMDASGGFIE